MADSKEPKNATFDPVAGWLRRKRKQLLPLEEEFTFDVDGEACLVRGSCKIEMERIRGELETTGLCPYRNGAKPWGTCDFLFLDRKESTPIGFPFGAEEMVSDREQGIDRRQTVRYPATIEKDMTGHFWGPEPTAISRAGDFRHLRWGPTHALWRPFDLLASYKDLDPNPLLRVLVDPTGIAPDDWDDLALLPLEWWRQTQGEFCLHAGLAGGEEGLALILGPSGSGKTTSILALVRSGFGYGGEELCLLRRDAAAGCELLGFASRPKLAIPPTQSPWDLEQGLEQGATPVKSTFEIDAQLRHEVTYKWLPPTALFFLERERNPNREHRLQAMTPQSAFSFLLDQVLDIGLAGRTHLETLTRLAQYPAFHLSPGPDLSSLADLVTRELRRIKA